MSAPSTPLPIPLPEEPQHGSGPGLVELGTPVPDPLLTALSQVLAHFGVHKSEEALAAGFPHQRPLQMASFSRIAQAHGCRLSLQSRALDRISSLLLPVVLLLDRGEACLLLGPVKGSADLLVLPCERGALQTPIAAEELALRYTGQCIFIRPETRTDERGIEAPDARPRDWFWSTIGRYRSSYVQAAVAATFINLLTLAGTFFTMNVYDRVVANQAYVTLWTLASGVTLAMLFEYLLRNLRAWLLDSSGRKSDLLLGARLYRQAMATRLENRPQSAGAYANSLREFEAVRDFVTSATLATISDLPFIALFIVVIGLIAGPLFWVPLAALPVLLLVGLLAQVPLSRYVRENLRESSVKHGILVETLEAAETVKALRLESRIQSKYERASALVSGTAMKSRAITAMVTNFTVFVQSLVTVIMVVWGVYLIGDGELTMGALVGAVLLSSRAIGPAASITSLAVRFQQARMAMNTLDGVMRTPTDRAADRNYVHMPAARGALAAASLSYRYGQAQKVGVAGGAFAGAGLGAGAAFGIAGRAEATSGAAGGAAPAGPEHAALCLRDVTLSLPAGERVAVLGRIGSGKSTLLRVLAGLYTPVQGRVTLDGVDLAQIEPVDVRRHVLYVGQEVQLLFGTLRENLKAGNPDLDDAVMIRVATDFGVHAIALAHSRGYDMPIGEHGAGLSGGQRQAVALVRAVLANPMVFLLDEPTSAMDAASELQCMNALARHAQGRSLVYVTHKVQLVDFVSRIVILDAGRVVADGPRDRVLDDLQAGRIRGGTQGPDTAGGTGGG